MVTQFGMDIFNDPFFIGFDRLTNRISAAHSSSNGFPPYNVRKIVFNTKSFFIIVSIFFLYFQKALH